MLHPKFMKYVKKRKKERKNVFVTCAAACGWCVSFHAAIRLLSIFRGRGVVAGISAQVQGSQMLFLFFLLSAGLKIANPHMSLPERWVISFSVGSQSRAFAFCFCFLQ